MVRGNEDWETVEKKKRAAILICKNVYFMPTASLPTDKNDLQVSSQPYCWLQQFGNCRFAAWLDDKGKFFVQKVMVSTRICVSAVFLQTGEWVFSSLHK